MKFQKEVTELTSGELLAELDTCNSYIYSSTRSINDNEYYINRAAALRNELWRRLEGVRV